MAVRQGFAVLVAAASATTPPIATQAWSGRTLALAPGKTATLRLSEQWRWTTPQVSGDAVRLIRIDYDRDPGYRAWSIRARHTGNVVIRSTGQPGSKRFVLYVHVR